MRQAGAIGQNELGQIQSCAARAALPWERNARPRIIAEAGRSSTCLLLAGGVFEFTEGIRTCAGALASGATRALADIGLERHYNSGQRLTDRTSRVLN